MDEVVEKYLSYSKISTYLQCSQKYLFRYVDKVKPEFTSPAIIYGSAVHRAIEYFHRNIGRMKVELDELFAIFENEFEIQVSSHGNVHWGRSDKESLSFTGFQSLGNYYKKHRDDKPSIELIAPDTKDKVQGVELNFVSPIEDNDEYKLNGVIDLIQLEEDILKIIDHKTSLKKYDNFQVDTNLQLVIYSYAFRNLLLSGYQLPVNKDKEDIVAFNVLLKDKNNDVIRYERKINDLDIHSMLTVVKAVIYGIENKIFLPTYSMDCIYCDFREHCRNFKPGVGSIDVR